MSSENQQLQEDLKELRENKDKMETHYKFIEQQKSDKVKALLLKIENLKQKNKAEGKTKDSSKALNNLKKELQMKNDHVEEL